MRVLIRRIRGRKKAPNWSGIVDEVARTMERETKPMLLDYHKRIVDEWSGEKPVFKARKVITKDYIAIDVYPTGGKGKDKWIWLTQGTKPHVIVPKREGGILAFPLGYKPRTKAGASGQYKGPGKANGKTVYAKKVNHPGTKPRHLTEAIARWAKPKFTKQIENAIRRGVRKA